MDPELCGGESEDSLFPRQLLCLSVLPHILGTTYGEEFQDNGCSAPIPWIRGCYDDVHTQGENTLTYVRLSTEK